MKLRRLLRGISEIEVKGSQNVEISSLSSDSRTIVPGSLFFAKKGTTCDGGDFIRQAVQNGAVAIVAENFDPFLNSLTQIICKNPGQIEARLAARYYGKPSGQLFIAGVTGTKGKTTTSYIIRHLLEGLGKKCGLIGTVETILGEKKYPSTLTTHGAIQNQKLLREMVLQGCQAAVLEVSSHGLSQGRIAEISFDLALFTNLYPDHLDYHKTIEEYAAAKRKLFETCKGQAILNADSPWAQFMREGRAALSFGIDNKADIQASQIELSQKGVSFSVGRERFQSPLIGRFNIYNLLGAIGVGVSLGVPLKQLAEILSSFQLVPGRLESVPNERGIQVFVDYAHTGEALASVLQALREIGGKRIIALFGCGGNRDPARREKMAAAAETFADLSIVTSDNPRKEDPLEIGRQILAAFQKPAKVLFELDRKKAIERAIQLAEAGDIVLIAGKGHERMQIFANQMIPFDDIAIAKEALKKLAFSAIL